MKIDKTVTAAMLAANRANARKSTGPKTDAGKKNARRNATRHRLLAAHLVFASADERNEFEVLVASLKADFQPEGLVEEIIVEDIATTLKKIQIALPLEFAELVRRRGRPDTLLSTILESDQIALPLDPTNFPMEGAGWEFESLIVRAEGDNDNAHTDSLGGAVANALNPGTLADQQIHERKDVGKRLGIQAVLGNPLDRLTRYQAHLKRDFYRAIETLTRIQAERIERECGQ